MPNVTVSAPWIQGKWRSQEEQRIQTLDLLLKILIPLILSVCLVAACKIGSFNGYLQLLSRKKLSVPPSWPWGPALPWPIWAFN